MKNNTELEEFKSNIRVVEIQSSSFEEENFMLLTTLTDEQIEAVLKPLIEQERDEEENPDWDVLWDNEALTQQLTEAYPDDMACMYQSIETIDLRP